MLVAVTVLVLAATGAYRPRITLSALDEAPRSLPRLGLALLLVAPFASLAGGELSLAVQALWAVPCFVVGRGVGYALVRSARRHRVVEEATLVVGGGRLGMDLLATMQEHPEFGLRGVGFLTSGSPLDDREPLGRMEDLDLVLDTYDVRKVVVAYGPTREAELVDLVRSAALRDIEVYIVPRFFDVGHDPERPGRRGPVGHPAAPGAPGRAAPGCLAGQAAHRRRCLRCRPSSSLRPGPGSSSPVPCGSAAPAPCSSGSRAPATAATEIAILKFRTLKPAAPVTVPGGARGRPARRGARCTPARSTSSGARPAPGTCCAGPAWTSCPSCGTSCAATCRLVGPRPEERTYAAQFADTVYGYRDRHRLAVGLTGWAQIHGLRGDTSIEERARFDNSYIEHWSLWRDIVILSAPWPPCRGKPSTRPSGPRPADSSAPSPTPTGGSRWPVRDESTACSTVSAAPMPAPPRARPTGRPAPS